jgi:RNA polymerase sigma-70 factor (ECF subfamily)
MPATEKATSLEDSLVTRLRLREDGAAEELMREYSGRLRRVVMTIVRDPSDADDVVQKSLWKAYQSMQQYRGSAALFTWLVSIARNESLSLIRARKARFVSLDEVRLTHSRPGLLPSPEQIAIREDLVRLCLDCVTHLRPRIRTIVIMRLVEDQSHEGIADQLKISVNAVKVRYHRGFKTLCELVGKRLAQPQSLAS